jgi:hypothetical protein
VLPDEPSHDMANAYTPGLRISEATVLRKERRLPLPGQIHVAVGQRVSPQDVIASTSLPGNVTTVNVARELNLQPEEVPSRMLKHEGETVAHGELIAEVKALFGLFHSTARSPLEGTIEAISPITGQVLVRGEPIPVNLEAYISGEVVEVHGDEGVVIETTAAMAQGIFGFGGETHGLLQMRAKSPGDVLDAGALDEGCRGKIVVGGSLVTLGALNEAVALGIRAIVVGGVSDTDVDSFLGYPLGVAITGHEQVGITLVVTEGFGQIAMARRTFELLRQREGTSASVNGATQIRAGVIRPEVIVSYPAGHEPPVVSAADAQGMMLGSPIRLIRDPYFGALGTITSLPEELRQIETEASVRVLVAELEDGRLVEVPRANVELIEG